MVYGHGELVLRKARGEWRFAAIAVFVVFALPFVVAAVAAGLAGEWIVVAIVGPLTAVPTILIWGHLRFGRIVVTADEIAVRSFVVHRRSPRAPAARVVRADVVQPRAPVVDTVFVLDAAGQLLIRIDGHHYSRADIDRLVSFLGLPWSGPDRPVTGNQLSAQHPGLLRWHEAHPLQFAMWFAGGTVVVVVVAALVLSVLVSPT